MVPNCDRKGSDTILAPGHAPQETSQTQVQRHHALTHHSGANDRTVKNSPQSLPQGRSKRIARTRPEHLQDQPPDKKKKCKAWASENTVIDGAVIGEDEENPKLEEAHEEVGETLIFDNGSRIRWTNNRMEWLDVSDSQWSELTNHTSRLEHNTDVRVEPAGYHRDHRVELFALDTQQPGAPGKPFQICS